MSQRGTAAGELERRPKSFLASIANSCTGAGGALPITGVADLFNLEMSGGRAFTFLGSVWSEIGLRTC